MTITLKQKISALIESYRNDDEEDSLDIADKIISLLIKENTEHNYVIAYKSARREAAMESKEVAQNCKPHFENIGKDYINNPVWNIGRLDAVMAIQEHFDI